jgi:succinate dehydrogenase assembly factor 1
MSIRHSKIQLKVLSLYKACLRAAKDKPGFDQTIRTEFKKNSKHIEKSDILRIEHLIRHGERKLNMIKDPNVSGMGHFVEENNDKNK